MGAAPSVGTVRLRKKFAGSSRIRATTGSPSSPTTYQVVGPSSIDLSAATAEEQVQERFKLFKQNLINCQLIPSEGLIEEFGHGFGD